VLSVEGNVVAYVVMTPAMLESPSEDGSTTAPGIISLESADGTAFKITEVSPPVIKDLNTESKLRHTLTVDWANWESAGRSPKISIKTDHPKSPSLTMLVKRSMVGKNAPTAPDANKPVAGPGTTDLVNAVRSGDLAKVSSVIASGADVNERDRAGQKTAMHWAAKTGNRAAMEALVAAKADPNVKDRQGRTPLWSGVETDVEVVKFLVDKGADVNARDLIKSTPLLWASGFGKPETVAFLLSKGADVKATDDNGWTPLIWAAGLGQPMTVDILVKSGADLTVADQTAGDTALLRAARTGKPESLKILIAAGADVSVKNKAGQTSLHLAAASGNVEKVQQLLAAKADPAAVDAKGWAPIDHAMNRTAGDKTKLLEVLRPVSPAPQVANPAPAGDAAAAPKQ
jgi:ankyrin repeat protein